MYLFAGAPSSGLNQEYVAGHVVHGLGLISGSVATVATVATKFSRIPENSQSAEGDRRVPPAGFPQAAVLVLSAIPVVLALVAWSFSIANLAKSTTPGTFMVGHVDAGLSMICTCLIALVVTILRQVQNTFGRRDRIVWRRTLDLADRAPILDIFTALTCLFPAAFVFQAALVDPNVFIAARVLVGLGAICFSLYAVAHP